MQKKIIKADYMELIRTFEAANKSNEFFMWAAGAVIGMSLVGLYLGLFSEETKEKWNYNLRMLAAMLSFFVMMIAAGTMLFSWMTKRKIADIELYATEIKTPYGTAKFSNIADIYFEESIEPTWIGTNGKRHKMLIISEKDKKGHVLSEENYKVQEIANELKIAMDEWKKKSVD